jgi:hypothetical protein
MKRTSGRVLVPAMIYLTLLAVPATGQRQDATVVAGTVTSGRISVQVGPDGTGVMVLPDGSVQSFDASEGGGMIVAGPDGIQQMKIGPAGEAQPMNINPGNGGIMVGPDGVRLPLDPAQIRQRLNDSLKQALGCTDEEWAVIEPRIVRVQSLQAAAGERSSGAVLLASQANSSSGSKLSGELRAKQGDLRKAIASGAAETDIKQKLAAVRDVRTRIRTELAKAREELTALLTRRQEAILYDRGILD